MRKREQERTREEEPLAEGREGERKRDALAEGKRRRRKKNLSHMKRSSKKERRRTRRKDEKKETEQVKKESMPKDLEEIQQENTNLGDIEDFETTPSKKTEIVEYRPWSDLRIDLVELIALHLFRADFVHLTCSCRSWRSIAPPSQITERHLSLLTSRGLPFLRNHSPWLMYFGKDNGMCNFLDPLYNERYFINIPELSGSTICFCRDGWVFIYRGSHSVFLFNPFIKAKIGLPEMEYGYNFNCITFSSTPTSSDSTIFAIESISTSASIYICRRGDQSWTNYHFHSNLPFSTSYSNPVFKDEVFYVLGHNGRLGVFDPKGITWTILAKPKPLKFCNCRYIPLCKWEYYLVESSGELLMVVIGFPGTPIHVFRLELSEMEWVKIGTLEDRMLFISRWTSLSSTSLAKGMEDKIHFPVVSGEDCVFYSLKDCRCYPKKDFYECEEYIYSTWIEPRWFQPSAEELDWSQTFEDKGFNRDNFL